MPLALLWILNLGNLCSGQDFLDYDPAGDMETGVRHFFRVPLRLSLPLCDPCNACGNKKKSSSQKGSDPGKHSFWPTSKQHLGRCVCCAAGAVQHGLNGFGTSISFQSESACSRRHRHPEAGLKKGGGEVRGSGVGAGTVVGLGGDVPTGTKAATL